jgi:hypothetical protein
MLLATLGLGLGLGFSTLAATPTVAPPPDPVAQTAPEPPMGNNMFGFGIFGVTLGILNIGYGVPLLVEAPGDAVGLGLIPIGFGAGFIALGAVGIHYGKQRRAVWRAWAAANPEKAELARKRPSNGVPQLIVGSVMTGAGVATIIPMASILSTEARAREPIGDGPPDFAYALTVMGISSVICGTGLLISGGLDRARFRESRRGSAARLRVVPVPWGTPHGAGLGLVGRF